MSRRSVILFTATLSLLTACREAKVESYRVPKEAPPPATAMPSEATGADMASTAVPTGTEHLTWTAPAHWTAKPASAMRKGSFGIKGAGGEADLSITAFPGDTGGLLANLNRWRGQIALPPLSDAQLEGHVTHLDANGLHFDVVDFAGTANGAPTRILGAVLSRPGETWFFKLMGPDALTASEKAAFADFLKTVKAP
ncbi:MAG: hypothetical protein KA257_12565 [Opitutaceae bacterium]|nr:hypothetical protein [Opitutaceae bacterium]MBP9914462.1 hypothetical protein [Opitutaceae bacterium]